jgi:carboxyl-terminal processing protease
MTAPTMINRRSRVRFGRVYRAARLVVCGLGLLVFGLSGCAGVNKPLGHAVFQRTLAAEVFSTGLEAIQTYYIGDVTISDMALRGMAGLVELDPDFGIERQGSRLLVLTKGRPVAEFQTPKSNDVPRWAILTSAVVDTGRRFSPRISTHSGEEIYQTVFDAILKDLDGYSRYVGAVAANRERQQREGYTGIGVALDHIDGEHKILSVFEGSPADKIGLRPKDVLSHVNGSSVQRQKLRALARSLRGPPGSRIALTIRRNGQPLAFALRRGHVIEPTVRIQRQANLLHVEVLSFSGETAQSLSTKLRDELAMGPTDGLVLDLRGNRGGVLTNAVDLSDLFLTSGPILATRGRHPLADKNYTAHRSDTWAKMAMIVLIDRKSASASEAVAAALQDRGRALVIGARTHGKGSVQMIANLPNAGEMILTWAQMFAPSGYPLSRFGVLPAICLDELSKNTPRDWSRLTALAAIGATRNARRRQANELSSTAQTELLESCEQPADGERDLALDLARHLLQRPNAFRRAIEASQLAAETGVRASGS